VVPHGLMNLADRGRGGGLVVELGETVPPVLAEIGCQHLVHRACGKRRCRFLKPGQRGPVRPGQLWRKRGFEDRQCLSKLERAALELSEHTADLLRGPRLNPLSTDPGGPPADPLAEPEYGTARQPGRQGSELHRAGDSPARQVAHDLYCRLPGGVTATWTGRMGRPSPAPPSPVRKDELKCPVG